MISYIRWMSQGGANDRKHGHSFSHPVATCLVHYALVILVTVSLHDWAVSHFPHTPTKDEQEHIRERRHFISDAVAIYIVCVLGWRVWTEKSRRNSVIYEYTWLCNITLFMGALALRTGRPVLATAFCIAVSIDQVLWYADLAGYAISGFRKFPIGVAKYITWPETPWATRVTCTHHMWTIPLLVYASDGLHPIAYPLSVGVVITNVLLSRWMTPFHVQHKEELKYLNVNLSHELWKDIKFRFLQINHDDPPVSVYLFRLLWRWSLFNFVTFSLLFPVCYEIFGDAPVR